MARWAWWIAAFAAGCASERARAPEPVALAPPPETNAPEPELPECPLGESPASTEADVDASIDLSATGCVVSGLGRSPDAPLTLHRSAELDAPIATISAAHPTLLSDFREGSDVARLSLRGSIALRGYAHVGGIELRNPDLLWIHPKLVSADANSRIRIVRFREGRLDVRVATQFETPEWLDASARCDELSIGEPFTARAVAEPKVRELPESDVVVEPVRLPTTVYDAPGGRELFSYVYSASSDLPYRIEKRGAFVRIAGRFGNIALDAWVPSKDVAEPKRLAGWSRTRVPKLRMGATHVGEFVIAPAGADVFVGQPDSLARAGRLVPKARVRTRGSDGDFVAIVTLDGIAPPRDADFWVRRTDVIECRVPKQAP